MTSSVVAPIKLLPDRESATAQAWLSGQPQIFIVAQDRGGGFALAASKALPHALQVADRWHLIENASAFLGTVRKSMLRDRVGDLRHLVQWSDGGPRLKLIKRQIYGARNSTFLNCRSRLTKRCIKLS